MEAAEHESAPDLMEFIDEISSGPPRAGDAYAGAPSFRTQERPAEPPGLEEFGRLRGDSFASAPVHLARAQYTPTLHRTFQQPHAIPSVRASGSAQPFADAAFDTSSRANPEQEELWMCRACGSTENRWSTTTNSWFCASCGSAQLYDAFQPTQEQTERGVWTYAPFESGSASTSPRSSIATSPSTVPRPGVRRSREPHGPPGDGFAAVQVKMEHKEDSAVGRDEALDTSRITMHMTSVRTIVLLLRLARIRA